uniref:Uncharacterized protein n=1 Tax=Arundo donax TaxID=35708 RepID=A0A0A9NKU3_ARUDO
MHLPAKEAMAKQGDERLVMKTYKILMRHTETKTKTNDCCSEF